jgi:signal transduction histidine kinase
VLSSEDDPDIKAKAFAVGANDYLVKWPDPRELVARVRYHSDAFIARRQRDDAFVSLRHSQEQLAASQSALFQAQKMEAIGQLTGGVAHDFNNVLQIIGGNLQLLKLVGGLNAGKARVDTALAGVERGAKLSSHLLAFARRQPLQAVVVDPGHLLREMDDMMRRVLGPRARVVTDIEPGLGSTLVDPNQLNNVLLNLAINARDAMGGGGTLTIRAANAGPDSAAAVAGGRRYVLIEIADTGHGMPPDVLERAFEPFFTTKPTGQGTGLGLSMAYGFVKQSGGEIVLESEPGRAPACASGCRAARPRRTWPRISRRRRCWAGWRPSWWWKTRKTCAAPPAASCRRSATACWKRRTRAAAKEIVESGEQIDLVFSDVIMPGPVSSLQLGEAVRARLPQAQILYTSGYAEGVLAHEGRMDAGVNLLQKPYHPDALSARIRHLLRRPASAVTCSA